MFFGYVSVWLCVCVAVWLCVCVAVCLCVCVCLCDCNCMSVCLPPQDIRSYSDDFTEICHRVFLEVVPVAYWIELGSVQLHRRSFSAPKMHFLPSMLSPRDLSYSSSPHPSEILSSSFPGAKCE